MLLAVVTAAALAVVPSGATVAQDPALACQESVEGFFDHNSHGSPSDGPGLSPYYFNPRKDSPSPRTKVTVFGDSTLMFAGNAMKTDLDRFCWSLSHKMGSTVSYWRNAADPSAGGFGQAMAAGSGIVIVELGTNAEPGADTDARLAAATQQIDLALAQLNALNPWSGRPAGTPCTIWVTPHTQRRTADGTPDPLDALITGIRQHLVSLDLNPDGSLNEDNSLVVYRRDLFQELFADVAPDRPVDDVRARTLFRSGDGIHPGGQLNGLEWNNLRGLIERNLWNNVGAVDRCKAHPTAGLSAPASAA